MVKNSTPNTLSDLLSSRRENFRVAMIAVVAALAVGILASALVEIFSEHVSLVALIAASALLLSLVWIGSQLRHQLEFEDNIEAALIFERRSKKLISLPGYKFSGSFARTLAAIAAENRAIYSEWEKGHQPDTEEDTEIAEPKDSLKSDYAWISVAKVPLGDFDESNRSPSSLLIEEITEYLLIEDLSLHLSSFFDKENEGESIISEFQRKDIPGFLLDNRVLNLLSTPIEQRDVFLEAFPDESSRPNGEIHSLMGSSGARFTRFDLHLPKDSKITKVEEGFKVETSRFSIVIRCQFSIFSANIPSGFCELVLGKNFTDVLSKKVYITISGRIKPLSLLRTKGWSYYAWLDSFRGRVCENFSFEEHFENINWNSAKTILGVIVPAMRAMNKRDSSPAGQ